MEWKSKSYMKKPIPTELLVIAKDLGGKCLSNEYEKSNTNLHWECKEGHRWLATPSNIRAGKWCRVCRKRTVADNQKKYSIIDFQRFAAEKGGKCLSTEYGNNKSKMEFECGNGHRFQKIARGIAKGEWCPECGGKINEKICRIYFEHIFNKKFPTKKPNWLNTKDGELLELDGYCEELNIAFEHQGEQHYRFVKYFHKTPEGLLKRKKIDRLKKKLCIKNNVSLFIIPEIGSLTPIQDIFGVIEGEALRLGIKLPDISKEVLIDWSILFNHTEINELKEIATSKGGRLISENYKGSQEKLLWECRLGHQWSAVPASVRVGTWCKKCASSKANLKNKKTINDVKIYVEAKGGICLSSSYENNHTKLLIKCRNGHEWSVHWANLCSGKWCPECAGTQQKSLEYLSELAAKHEGRIVDTEYQGMRHKYTWSCSSGHTWKAIPGNVTKGNWCQRCSGSKKTIEDLVSIAKENGGDCLSKKFLGSVHKYKWKCQKGHVWEALYGPIISKGVWCSDCNKKKGRLQDLIKVAGLKGGKCLSKKYEGVSVKYLWECANGHRWKAVGRNVKQGQWCPTCAVNNRRKLK